MSFHALNLPIEHANPFLQENFLQAAVLFETVAVILKSKQKLKKKKKYRD